MDEEKVDKDKETGDGRWPNEAPSLERIRPANSSFSRPASLASKGKRCKKVSAETVGLNG